MEEALPMDFDIRFPRALEGEGAAEEIRRTLADRRRKLWAGGVLDVPAIAMSEPLIRALREAKLRGRIRCGFESVRERLASERKGIEHVRERQGTPHGERVSRLILFSNDGAERFYRHVEGLIEEHAPRLFGCLLETDSSALGRLIVGRESRVKLVMAEHKEAVAAILRAIAEGSAPGSVSDGQGGAPPAGASR